MISINDLALLTAKIANKDIKIKNIDGAEFVEKYGFKCPLGVRGRKSDNALYLEKIGWTVSSPLSYGIEKTYLWIEEEVKRSNKK
jgi:nucleoside-diphosphate-sugar epimerase